MPEFIVLTVQELYIPELKVGMGSKDQSHYKLFLA